jgi:two-component system chemotaxis response regulator CheY
LSTPTKVLIIDDSEPLHQIYKITLKRYPCEVITALRREEGLQKLIENPDVNLILVDLNMSTSRMSAIEFIRKVKEHDAFKNIPVVVVSTRGKEVNIQEDLALAQGNLRKPFTSNEIHAAIIKLFPLEAPEPKALP